MCVVKVVVVLISMIAPVLESAFLMEINGLPVIKLLPELSSIVYRKTGH